MSRVISQNNKRELSKYLGLESCFEDSKPKNIRGVSTHHTQVTKIPLESIRLSGDLRVNPSRWDRTPNFLPIYSK